MYYQHAALLTCLHIVTYWVTAALIHEHQKQWPYLRRLQTKSEYKLVVCNQVLFGITLWLLIPSSAARTEWYHRKYAASLLATLLLYDPLFFVLHRAMHRFGSSMHQVHHQSSFTPVNALAAHPVDVLVSAYGPILICAAVLPHTLINYVVLVVGASASTVYSHSYHNPHLEEVNVGIVYKPHAHQVHHMKPTRNFGDGLMLMDRLCGTFSPPAPSLVEQYFW